MKQLRLMMVMLLAMLVCQANAQTWVPADVADGNYYVLNVGSNMYWGAGNDWGTRASLVDIPDYVTFAKLEDGTYTMESRVNNGGTSYYFGGDYMDGSTPAHLTIETNGDLFVIGDGNILYGYDGSSTILGKNLTDKETPNAQWKLIPEAEMLTTWNAALAEASVDNPVSATFLLKDPNFNRNHRDQSFWQITANNANLSGGNNLNNCAESYHSTFVLSQTVEGVPNGVYAMTAQGFYRQDGSGINDLPVFYINDETTVFPVRTGSENSMSAASESFTNGLYTISPVFVKVENGTITVGARNENNTTLWCIWDNFQLTYFGDVEIGDVKFSSLVKSLDDLRVKADNLQGAEGISDAAKQQLMDVLTATADVEKTEDALNAAIQSLTSAINGANASVKAKTVLDAMKAQMDATNVYTAEAYEAYKAVYDNLMAKYNEGTITIEEANALENPSALIGWHIENIIDDLLLSAWGVSNYDSDLYINTWSVEGQGDGTNFLVPFFEYWTGDANSLAAKTHTATLEGLAAGKYSITGWVRVRAKNGYTAPATGITMQLNDGSAVDVTAGQQVGTSQFYIDTFRATGEVGEDGKMQIKFNILDGNNISWLSFKNLKYEPIYEGANLDFAESTPLTNGICTYAKDMETNGTTYSQQQPVEGWDIAVENGDARAGGVFAYGADENAWLGGKGYVAPATNPEGTTEGNALGIVAVWTATVQYTQKLTLEAGNYVITVPIYNSVGGASVPVKSLIGFIADDGKEYLADAKAYPVGTWTNEVITFKLDKPTTGVLSLGYQGQNVGSGNAQHLFIDRVDIQTVSSTDAILAELEKAIAVANAKIEAREGVGEGLFAIPESAVQEYMNAVYAAQDVYDKEGATEEEIQAAIDALTAAGETYANSAVKPDADKKYTFKQKASGLYLSVYDDGENGNGVRLAEEPQQLSFVPADGGYYITDGTLYVGLAGTNNWTMSALADNKLLITVNNLGNGEYTLGEVKGFIGSDGTEVGAACFADKSTEKVGDRAIWTIEEYVEPTTLELAINVERMEKQGYTAQQGNVDFTEALAFLGIENISEAKLSIMNATTGELIDDYAPFDGWFNREGDAQNWGDNASVCVKFFQALESGAFDICDMGNANVPAVGETFTAKWALQANEKTVIYTINVLYTEYEEPIYQPEIIKTITIEHMELANTAYDNAGVAPTFNVADVCEALGIADINEAELYIVNCTNGNFVVNTSNIDGWRNADGDAAPWAESGNGFCLKLNDPASGTFDYSGAHDSNFNVGDTFTAKWGVVYNEKAVVLEVNITFVDEAVLTGINGVSTVKVNDIFTINGMKVNDAERLQKGIYIVNGKKVVVK